LKNNYLFLFLNFLIVFCKNLPLHPDGELMKPIHFDRYFKDDIKSVDRSKEIVVGTAIYLAHRDFSQAKTNEIIRKFSKCKPINFSRISKFLQLS